MRHPRTHKFLLWAGPTVFGGFCTALLTIAGLAAVWTEVKMWAQGVFIEVSSLMSPLWFFGLFLFAILAYVGALVYTGSPRPYRPWSVKSLDGLLNVLERGQKTDNQGDHDHT
jgi:hypothetical protein